MSWKAEVIADNSGKWAGNACRFATAEEAEDYALDLKSRWMLVRDWRIQKSDDPVNYVKPKGQLATGAETPNKVETGG